MEYKIIGTDGKEYGPVTLDQLKQWVKEGRVNGSTLVLPSGQSTWSTAADLPELAVTDQVRTPNAAPELRMDALQEAQAMAPIEARLKSCASWFYWIAGLSIINTVAALSGGTWRFILGLGITQIIDAIGHQIGSGGHVVAAIMDLAVIATFITFGVFAHKHHKWAFLMGMILFALDSLIFLISMDVLSIIFHAFVIFRLFQGFKACGEIAEMKAALRGTMV